MRHAAECPPNKLKSETLKDLGYNVRNIVRAEDELGEIKNKNVYQKHKYAVNRAMYNTVCKIKCMLREK